MIKSIKKEDWSPANGLELEDNALTVVTNPGNYLVLAGPGAGKTELLAQKACFLLETNTCRYPRRILAISFKRDAAFNLKQRLNERCEEELARRFDSMTFDSFAKQLLDRFHLALPAKYAIDANYEIVTKDPEILKYYQVEDPDQDYDVKSALAPGILKAHAEKPLPLNRMGKANKLRHDVWKRMLAEKPSKLSFKMVMRLADLIIKTNPKIKTYLQQTYQFVFLDEFQDSTDLQYGFFKSCFLGSASNYTAVGDDKQRIMLWAGALDAVFDDFINDTNAVMMPLKMNFRCAPRLVELLNHLAKYLLGKTDVATPSKKWKGDEGECLMWVYEDQDAEIKSLLVDVQKWIKEDRIDPREICILVKRSLQDYAGALIAYFNANGIKTRDENVYQEALSKEVIQYIVHVIYLVFGRKDQESKNIVINFTTGLYLEYEDEQLLRLENAIHSFIKTLSKKYGKITIDTATITTLTNDIVQFAGLGRIQAAYPNYKKKKTFDDDIKVLTEMIGEALVTTSSIAEALDQICGVNTIPVMTVHKSKGLEYHTVIFIGLEDSAFWKFNENMDEDKCTFFVALSRAKQRVVFTFSKKRTNSYGTWPQGYTKIKVIFDELLKSGIVKPEARDLPAAKN
jgi:DNA helicase-2/ATP-dependent DNA helicase PcrA